MNLSITLSLAPNYLKILYTKFEVLQKLNLNFSSQSFSRLLQLPPLFRFKFS